jgi:hypothetical protein
VPCLVLLLALFSPRIALVAMAVFSDRLSAAFDGVLTPLIGFFLLPWTTLMYALLWGSGHRVTGFEWFLVGIAFLFDVASWGGGARGRGRYHGRDRAVY